MKRAVALFSLMILCAAPAAAGCRDGEQLELSGRLVDMFANKAGGWSLKVDRLNPDVIGCDLGMLMGQKTASGPWFLLAVKGRQRPACGIGSPIHATLRLSELLVDFDAETVNWRCE